MVSILSILVFCFPAVALSASFRQIFLPPAGFGPESLAFEFPGGAFYTGVSDGRVLRYQPLIGFTSFAFTSPNRTMALCDGTTDDPDKGPICGRPFGLAYNPITRQLYIADAYYGLLVVDSNGGLAKQIATGAEGQPFVFCNGLDIDPITRNIYFTDTSAVYDLRNSTKGLQANDSTGRLLKYDVRTNQVTVLMRNLSGAAGAAVSGDGRFVLVSEFVGNRIQRYWLTGSNAGTSEIILSNLNIVRPNNIKRTILGDFLIAAATVIQASQTLVPIRVRVDGSGTISETVSLEAQYGSTRISEAQQSGLSVYVSSRGVNFVGEPVEGKIVINSPSSISHHGIRLSVTGSVNLQVRGGSAGVIESFYGVVKPITIVSKSIEVKPSGKIGSGTTELPFTMVLKKSGEKSLGRFYETFHGTDISIQYLFTVDIARGYLYKSLSATTEVIVESDKADVLERPVSPEMAIFYITQDTQRHPLLPEIKSGGFRVTGRISTLCSLLDPISGELTVETSAVPISSIDIHLLRVESVLIGEKIIADGDVCRNLTLPIYVILPRLLTCPSVFAGPFSIEFKVSIVISFQSELSKLHKKSDPRTPRLWLAMETLPLELVRTR
ncbi:hypothetical protein SADUNF_Sadunf15G0032200 [Salix dunnii]|uniref:Strictosidine synthase conserved region domain-containing protein n=1 Tax=Salix dunnii TaxID=1413687 RepID=A0A835JI07_9ROSI|nr:hypothetical protein SADUNF_Sadunf15G0032200 [Salix dunnii]